MDSYRRSKAQSILEKHIDELGSIYEKKKASLDQTEKDEIKEKRKVIIPNSIIITVEPSISLAINSSSRFEDIRRRT